jgi:hypothetical protein
LNVVTGGVGVAEETADSDPVFVSAGTTINLAAVAERGKDGLAVAVMTTGADEGGGGGGGGGG